MTIRYPAGGRQPVYTNGVPRKLIFNSFWPAQLIKLFALSLPEREL